MNPVARRFTTVTSLADAGGRIGRAVVGDPFGAALFVGACLVFGTIWQIGFLVNDSWTVANTLVGISDGHLYIDRVVFGQYSGTVGDSPGTHVVGRRVYGRNYGQVFFALPILWALEGLVRVCDPRIFLAGFWSLGLVLFSHQVGNLTERYTASVSAGCAIALAIFAGNAWLGTTLPLFWLPQLALQLSTILAAGLLVLAIYRLLTTFVDRRSAVSLAAIAAVGTPIALWSTSTKRHTLTALFVMLTLYAFVQSRQATADGTSLRFRALAYVWVGLLTWVHAAEGLAAFLALGSVDLATARSNSPRELATVGAAFLVSLLPFLMTNAVVTGNPLYPPRLWPSFDGTQPVILNGELTGEPPGQTDGTVAADGTSTASGASGFYISGTLVAAAVTLVDVIGQLWGHASSSLAIVSSEPIRLYQTFVRSGLTPVNAEDRLPVNLTVIQSAPVVAAAVALPVYAKWDRMRTPREWSSVRKTDLLVVVLAVLLVLIYLPRLPLRVQGTVRYLHPLYPLLLYAIARVPTVRALLSSELRIVVWSSVAGLLIGSQLVILALWAWTSTVGDAIQFHGMLNLSIAGLLLAWTLGARLGIEDDRYWSGGAVLFGSAVSAGAVAMLFMSWNHLAYGDPVLGMVRIIQLVIPH